MPWKDSEALLVGIGCQDNSSEGGVVEAPDRQGAYEGESVGANWGFQWTIATQCGPGQARPTSIAPYTLDFPTGSRLLMGNSSLGQQTTEAQAHSILPFLSPCQSV